jgi:hypothetical protein
VIAPSATRRWKASALGLLKDFSRRICMETIDDTLPVHAATITQGN